MALTPARACPQSSGLTTSPARNPTVITTSRPITTSSKVCWRLTRLDRQEAHRHREDDDATEHEGKAEQDVQRQRAADDLGHLGGRDRHLRLRPVQQPR